MRIPKWMTTEETYAPPTDRDGFTGKSLLAVLGVLGRIKTSGNVQNELMQNLAPSAPVKLLFCIFLIVLTSCAHNMFFVYCLLAVILAHMCFVGSKMLKQVVASCLGAGLLSMLLLLPAAFLGSPASMLTISCKVFVSVGFIGIMGATTPWNALTAGLRFYHVPDVFIFVFDITIKYIVILGNICSEMLTALTMRSVGRNNNKSGALSGILGVTYFKSRRMADEMCDAMACRGFEGEYVRGHSGHLRAADILYIAFMLAVLGLFIYLST